MGAMMPPPQAPVQAQDPRSQYLAQALQSMGQTPQQGSTGGLASNLMAEALLHKAYLQRQAQLYGQPSPYAAGGPAGAGGGFGGGMPGDPTGGSGFFQGGG